MNIDFIKFAIVSSSFFNISSRPITERSDIRQ